VRIGNSRGVRIPKAILQQCRIDTEVELQVEDGKILLAPVKGRPRDGWDTAFRQMADNGDDRLLIDDGIDIDVDGLEW
jgi:antitoxin MazE